MPRFFVDAPLALHTALDLPVGVARHAVGVLRLRAGDALTLFNGKGGEYHARLVEAAVKLARVKIESFDAREAELSFSVTVVQGVPAGDKMDWIVEKSTELGAVALQPLALERSVVRLSAERAAKRRAHWQSIAQASAEQCGRNRVPLVHEVLALGAWLGALPQGTLCLLATPRAATALDCVEKPATGTHIALAIGPEGGFSESEEDEFRRAGFQGISLGARVLRTETAALAALAILATAWH